MIRHLLLIVMLVLVSTSFAAPLAPSPYSVDHILSFKRISRVIASPNGKEVAYVIFERKKATKETYWEYSLYCKASDGKQYLVAKSGNISGVTWSPDGKELGFITQGNRYPAIFIINVEQPGINRLLEFNFPVKSFQWSTDGKKLAVVSNDVTAALKTSSPILDISLQHGVSHLYVIDLQDSSIHPKQLTPDEYYISQQFSWSPDSKQIAFAYQPKSGSTYSNQSKIAIIDVISKKITTIPYMKKYAGMQPFYSNDGKWIAFQSNLEASTNDKTIINDIELNNRICVINTMTLQVHCLANTFNENPSILGWGHHSNQVIVMEEYKTRGYSFYALDLNNPAQLPERLDNVDMFIEPLTVTLNRSGTMLAFGYETVNNPPEVGVSSVKPFKLEQISHLNRAHKPLATVEVIQWHAQDGQEIEGVLIKPVHYKQNKKYPLLVNVHGGPAGVWAKRYLGGCDEYDNLIEPTSCWGKMASLGYIIFAPNIRGSTGYGKAFRAANYADFGGKDYQDMMSGVDLLIKNGSVDEKQIAIAGWSFGGYLSAWAVSQSTRFKLAIDGAGNTDFISFSGTSDIPYYYVKYFGVPFWEKNDLYVQRAPIMHVKNITASMVILHGENDFRVPVSQSYELYTALKLQNKPVSFYVLPGQGHVPSDPEVIASSIDIVSNALSNMSK